MIAEQGREACACKFRSYPEIQPFSCRKLDVSSDESIFAPVKQITQISTTFDKLDVLVNNAGINLEGRPGPITHVTLLETFEVNTFGPKILTSAPAPLLTNSNDPRTVNIFSCLGSIGGRLDSNDPWYEFAGDAYRTSKAALNMASASHNFDNTKTSSRPSRFA